MLTPIEIRGKAFKSGMGYLKKPVDAFLEEVVNDYEKLYKENVELKDKIGILSEGIQYYKNIEKTLEKALVLAEKTSEETKESAKRKASAIETEAHARAKMIMADAKNETERLKGQITGLVQQYEKYRMQFKQLASSQLELLENTSYTMELPDEAVAEEAGNISTKATDSIEETDSTVAMAGVREEADGDQDEGETLADLETDTEEEMALESSEPDADDFAAIEEALRKQGENTGEEEAEETRETEKPASRRSGAMSDILERLNMKIARAEESGGEIAEKKQDDVFEFLDND